MFTITLFFIGVALLVIGLTGTGNKPIELFKIKKEIKKDEKGFPEYIDFQFEYVGSRWFLFGMVFVIASGIAGLFQV